MEPSCAPASVVGGHYCSLFEIVSCAPNCIRPPPRSLQLSVAMAQRFGPPSHLLQVWPFEVPCSPRRSSCPPSRRRVANRQRICRAVSSGIEPGWDQTSQSCFERYAVWCGTSRTSPWSRLIASADDLFRYRQLSQAGTVSLYRQPALHPGGDAQPSGFPERIALLSQTVEKRQNSAAGTLSCKSRHTGGLQPKTR